MQLPHALSRRRDYAGPAIFSFGFRPFFLGGASFALLSLAIWITAFAFGLPEIGGRPALTWHVHEMLFGFFAAIAVGFLLTAIPNWTGRLPITGSGLAGLFGLWVLGRTIMIVPLPWHWVGAFLDSLFLALFAAFVWREILASGNTRNLPVCLLITLLAVANIAFHIFEGDPATLQIVTRAALAVPAMLISVIGGRIVPSFTRNWLVQKGRTQRPSPAGLFDTFALIVAAMAFAGWVFFPFNIAAGALLVLAGGVHAIRLARWCGWHTRSEALVWILHVGYGWLVLAMFLLGLSVLAPETVFTSAAIHALTAGAMGVMILAVMTRATLGHTGQARTADGWTIAIYVLVIGAAILRVFGGLAPYAAYMPTLISAAILWGSAFGLFAVRYGPLLVKRRSAA